MTHDAGRRPAKPGVSAGLRTNSFGYFHDEAMRRPRMPAQRCDQCIDLVAEARVEQ
jgi:hypothetical protein